MMLINGLSCREEIVLWADENLKSDTSESGFWSELSLSSTMDVNELITFLDRHVGFERPALSARILLSILQKEFDAGNLRLEKVVQTMDWLARHTSLSTEEKSLLNGIDDKLSLAGSNVFGEQKEVEKEVRRFLQLYKGFSLRALDQWPVQTAELNEPLKSLFLQVRSEQTAFIEKQRKSFWRTFLARWK